MIPYFQQKLWEAPETAIVEISAEIWDHYGYTTDTDSESRHQGVDVAATRSRPYPRKEVIQVDHRKGDSLEPSVIQQAAALPDQEEADSIVIVSTGSLTEEVEELAGALDVIVIDIDSLASLVHSAELFSAIAGYLDLNDSRTYRINLETIADRVVANTPIDAAGSVYEELRSFFVDHLSSPRISENTTLSAFDSGSPEEQWSQSTTVSWGSNPEIDTDELADEVATHLLERDIASVEQPVLATVLSLEFDENIGESLKRAPAPELAEWYVGEFGESEVPLVREDPGLAAEVAGDFILPDESVAANKLRVARGLNQRYEDMVHEGQL